MKKCPKLEQLLVSENKLKEFGDMTDLPKLNLLDIGTNSMKAFPEELPDLQALTTFIMKENNIKKLKQLLLLSQWKNLRNIDVSGNPLEEEAADSIKKEILILMPLQFSKINDEVITQEERREAEEENQQRIKDAADKLKEEEEEKKRLEEEAKAGGEEEED